MNRARHPEKRKEKKGSAGQQAVRRRGGGYSSTKGSKKEFESIGEIGGVRFPKGRRLHEVLEKGVQNKRMSAGKERLSLCRRGGLCAGKENRLGTKSWKKGKN